MKWKLAWNQIQKNRFMSLFNVLELILLFVLMIAGSSIISYETKNYRSFFDLFSSKGYYIEVIGSSIPDSEKLQEKLKNASVLSCYRAAFDIQEKSDSLVLGYDTEFIKRYHPDLTSGKWLTDIPKNEEILHVVVGGTLSRQKTGTILHGITLNNKTFDIKVIGTLNNNATIIGHPNGTRQSDLDYSKIYTNMELVTVDGGIVLFDNSEMARLNQTASVNMDYGLGDVCLITYNKNITREDILYNRETLQRCVSYNEMYKLEDLNHYSLSAFKVKFYSILPLMVACFILTLITAICNGAILIKRQLYSYAIFYTCGMKWKDCTILNIYVNLLQSGIAFVIASGIVYFFIVGHYYLMTAITFTLQEVFVCIVIEILYLALAMILPSVMLHNNSAQEVLNKNKH